MTTTRTPDEETTALLGLMADSEYPPIWSLQAAEARAIHDPLTVASAHPVEPVERIEDREIREGLSVRIYWPKGHASPAPLLIYYHGGGGTLGNLDTHDAICRTLANAAEAITIAVDYRLGPEHRFPAAYEDARFAFEWTLEEAAALGGDAARLAVGGDSAGGGLAAAITQHAAAAMTGAPAYQLLIYPSLDASRDAERYPSVAANAEGYFLTAQLMNWFSGHYLDESQDRRDPLLSPGLATGLDGLAPALIITAGLDPLRDEAEAYAQALSGAGVDVDYRCYESTIHGFASFGRFLSFAAPALRDWAAAMRDAMDRTHDGDTA